MKIIEKIEIKSFRSFGNRKRNKTQISKIEELNIFSGSNDSGKSNVLRALNLFFNKRTNLEDFLNFKNDFFKRSNPDSNDIKEEQITIKISFINEKNRGINQKNPNYTRLPERFWVSRKWLKNSEFSAYKQVDGVETSFKSEKKNNWEEFYDDETKILKSNVRANLSKQLTDFLGSIQYHYIPAIKDKNYFSHLYGELQQTLLKEANSTVNRNKNSFQNSIQETTQQLMDEFKNVVNFSETKMSAVFELPDLINLFKTLNVQTDNVNLKYRGDGVQAKLIPEILNFIAKRELQIKPSKLVKGEKPKKYFIWGFEEPENSYEYKNAQLLADRFKTTFINNAQIFLTTHSFNFLSIESSKIAKYRVWKDNSIESTRITRIKKDKEGNYNPEGSVAESDRDRLNEELGIFHLNSELEKLFIEYKEKTNQLNQYKIDIEKKVKQSNKPLIFFEDEYLQIYQIAFLKLKGVIDFPDKSEELEILFNKESHISFFSRNGHNELNKFLDMVNIEEWKDKKIVGVFDFDSAFNQFKGLFKNRWFNILGDDPTGLYRTRKDHSNFHALVLPVPPHRELYASKISGANSALEIELYFENDVLRTINSLGEESIAGISEKRNVFKGKKSLFWKKILSLDSSHFIHFKLLFDKLHILTNV